VKKLSSTVVFLALIAGTCGSAPVAADEVTFSQVAKATKIYFRDSAEFPLRMNVEFTITDTSGHVRKHKTGKFNYDFHGYNSRSGNANAHLRGPRSLMMAAWSLSMSSFLSMTLLSPSAEKNYTFTIVEPPPEPGLVSTHFSPIPTCEAVKWSADAYMPKGLCGPLGLQLNRDDVSLQRFTFDETGLPAPANIDLLGPVTVLSYHVEADFQKLLITGDPKPFLVPKLVTVTVGTDKGKIVMSSEYALRKK
jgi:hypothetical protein